jgi:hypothetical protein
MKVIDDEAILQRAKEFCEENGTTWEELTADNHQRYLARAREQLLDEDATELISQGLVRDPETGEVGPFSLEVP